MRSIKVIAAIVALGLVSALTAAAPRDAPMRATDVRIKEEPARRAEPVARKDVVAGAPGDYYDATDLAALLSRFGCEDCDDLDGDRDIDADDIKLMLALFGTAKPIRSDDDDDEDDHDENDDDDDDGDDDDEDDDDQESKWRPPVGQDIPDHGFEWATITHPGNDAYEGFGFFKNFAGHGRVDYMYRFAKTEVTTTQWREFLDAYAPFAPDPLAEHLAGLLIFPFEVVGGGVFYHILSGWENSAATMTWHNAARYINWLHNGKVNEQWAFETGVYDTSTFGFVIIDGKNTLTDQATRAPGARFWIPNAEEWTKAAHWDPNMNGRGHAGYWNFPTTSDNAPIYDLPENGGESSGGARSGLRLFDPGPKPQVVWYPHITSPWGIYDMSGGWGEWLEDLGFFRGTRWADGGGVKDSTTANLILSDRISSVNRWNPSNWTRVTLRIASAIPKSNHSRDHRRDDRKTLHFADKENTHAR